MKKLSCRERDLMLLDPATGRVAEDAQVYSTLTDMDGAYGEPRMETTWLRDGILIRDVRHPGRYDEETGRQLDSAPCEH